MTPRACARAVALAALLAASGCREGVTPATHVVDTPPRERMDSLRALGRYEDALAVARARQSALAGEAGTPRWARDDARRDVATLKRILSAAPPERVEIARADASLRQADSLVAVGQQIDALPLIESQLAVRERVLGLPREPAR